MRFDGARFTVYDARNTQALKHSSVQALLADRDGTLWIATNLGLSRLKDGRFNALAEGEGLPNGGSGVMFLFQDSRGVVWAAGRGGVFRYESGRFIRVAPPPDTYYISIAETGDGSIWLSTWGAGLERVDAGGIRRFTSADGLSSNFLEGLFADRDGSLWIGSNAGLDHLTGGCFQHVFRGGEVKNILRDRHGTLWFGTVGNGLKRLREGTVDGISTSEGLSSSQVNTLFEDRERSLWIGMHNGGLVRLRDGKFTVWGTPEGLSGDVIQSMLEARDGSIWIGTLSGLDLLQGSRVIAHPLRRLGIDNVTVQALYEDPIGALWIGTLRGLYRVKGDSVKLYTRQDGLPTEWIHAITGDADGSLWFGGNGGGLVHFSGGRFQVYSKREGLPNDVIRSVHRDRSGAIWVGTNGGGVARFADGVFSVIDTKNGLPNDQVYLITEDPDGTLWIGTDGGLVRRRDGRLTSYTTEQGLFDDVVEDMLFTDKSIWIGSNRGFFRVERSELEQLASGAVSRVTPIVFGTADGLRSAESAGGHQPTGLVTRDGRIGFATIKGAAFLDPREPAIRPDPPPMQIEEIVVDGRAVSPGLGQRTSRIELPPRPQNVELHYTALTFIAPERVRFLYKLEGLDQKWVEAGTRRVAYYSRLPHGPYTFRVKACNAEGVWNEQGTAIGLVVAPLFYETRLFVSLFVIALLAAAYGTYRARVWRLKARERELLALVEERTHSLAEEKRKTEEANQAKSLFLASMSHELRTPLNAVLGFVQLIGRDGTLKAEHREHLSIITRSGEHLLGLINDVLSISKIEAGLLSLREETFDLPELLAGLKEVYGARAEARGLWLKVEITPASPPRLFGDAGKLRQVLINLLENAFRFTESGGISLLAKWTEGTVEFRIEDTGRGMSEEDRGRIFHIFGQAEAGERSKVGTGLGLYISRSFVRRMGGDIEVTSAPGTGTRFAFQIRLPAAPSDALEQNLASRVVALEAGQRSFRVLVADDLVENRTLLVRLLTSVGLEVREAVNGEEAVEVFKSFRPDVIFMDIRMPVLDGYGATRQIRDAEEQDGPSGRRTSIIGLTASAFEHDRETVLGAGCDDFLAKPFRESALFELMERHAGMRFVRESAASAGAPVAGELVLTRSRIGSVPADMRARLKDSLERGDLQEARKIIEEIREHDGPVAAALADSMRAYQIDRLLALVQGAAK